MSLQEGIGEGSVVIHGNAVILAHGVAMVFSVHKAGRIVKSTALKAKMAWCLHQDMTERPVKTGLSLCLELFGEPLQDVPRGHRYRRVTIESVRLVSSTD